MANYIVPQALVYQQLQILPAPITAGLNACIVGPNYDLVRFSESDEKPLGSLGSYDSAQSTCYLWPNRAAGSIVDQDWVQAYAENAWLKYWSNASAVTVPASGDLNRFTATSINFRSFGIWDRDASFYGRDVQLGDGVRVQATVGGDAYDVDTYVTGFQNAVINSSVEALTEDTDNQVDTILAADETQIAGVINEVEAVASGGDYDGRASGNVTETYTVEVTQGGVASAARLRVTSLSGTDNVLSTIPAAFGSATAIGTRGLDVVFSLTGVPSSAPGETFPEDEFVVGQKWEIDVTQAYTTPVAGEGGTYTGPSNTSYVVTVVQGGDLGETVESLKPLISVATTTGVDFGGPYTVADAVARSIGNYGVTIAFTGDGLVKGDRFIIPVIAQQAGAVRTLVLANALPVELAGEEVSVDLFIRKTVEIPRKKSGLTTATNFTTSATEICVEGSIEIMDDEWTNNSGTVLATELYKGSLYVSYRALSQAYAAHTHIFTLGDLPGKITPDNPFTYGLYKALTNSGGARVRGIAVATNNIEGYNRALDDLSSRNDVYGIVPMTKNRAIQDLVAAHVTSLSSPEDGRWRVCWLNSNAVETLGIYTDVAGETLLATIIDDNTTSGIQYTKVVISDGALITSGVLPGDRVRANYGVDAEGETIYEDYEVDRVVSEDVLILMTGPSAAVNIPSKIEIWRNLSRTEVAREYARLSGSFGNRRVRHIWPDFIGDSGSDVDGFYLCAALAGYRSGLLPHQGLTNMEILGFDSAGRTSEFFSKPQLDIMAAAGTWIVTQDYETGQIYSRHQLTTGNYSDQNQREDSITSNLDSISYYMLSLYEPYIGKANVTPEFVEILRDQLVVGLDNFTVAINPTYGAQITDYEIREFRQHAILRDRVVSIVDLILPFPFNNFELHLVI